MKKIILIIGIILSSLTIVSAATDEDSFTYTTLSNGTIAISGYSGTDTEVIIPETIDGLTVSRINSYAFYNNTTITSITLPDTVTYIDTKAFSNCSNLTTLNLNEGLTRVTAPIFISTGIEELYLPSTLTTISGGSIFNYDSNFKTISVADSNEYFVVVDNVLYSKDMKTLVGYPPARERETFTIPDTVETLGKFSFAYSQNLEELVVSENVSTISMYAFSSSHIMKITVKGDMDIISPYTFTSSSYLEEIIFEGSVSTIYNYAFMYLSSLKSITLPNNLNYIGSKWLSSVNSDVEYIIPDYLTKLDDGSYIRAVTLKLKTGNYDYDLTSEVFDLVNEERTNEGLDALVFDAELQEAAMERAKQLAVYFSHTMPDGRDPLVVYNASGENIAVGYTTSTSVMEDWMNSTSHKANILNSKYKSIGVGCFYQEGVYYWVQLFSTSEGGNEEIPTGVVIPDDLTVIAGTVYIGDMGLIFSDYSTTSDISLNIGDSFSPLRAYTVNKALESYFYYTPVAELQLDTFAYSSSNEEVFTVDEYGNITAVGPGKATLTASLGNDSITYDIIVYSINLDKTKVHLKKNESITLSPTVLPLEESSNLTLSYSSSDNSVALVDDNGVVTAVSDGDAVITVTTSTGLIANCTITVGDYIMGDLNQNGKIDLVDILMLIKLKFNKLGATNYYYTVGDFNGNGSFDLTDILSEIKLYFGKE